MCDYAVGDQIKVSLPGRQAFRGVIIKIISVQVPGWSRDIPGYTIIKYKKTNGEDGVCSNNSPCLRKLNALDLLAEIGDDG